MRNRRWLLAPCFAALAVALTLTALPHCSVDAQSRQPAPTKRKAEPQVTVTPPTDKYTVEISMDAPPSGAFVVWFVTPRDGIETISRTSAKWKLFAPKGRLYEVQRTVAIAGADQTDEFATFRTGEPKPPDPIPPQPPPVPPEPPPAPVPIPGDGLRVLVVWESKEATKYPAGQVDAIFSAPIRQYLNTKCPKGGANSWPEWRFYDVNVDLAAESATWQNAMKRSESRTTLPWVLISNGKTGFEGPMPATPNDFLALLKKYGGD